MDKHLPRTIGVLGVFLLLIVGLGLLFLAITPIMLKQLSLFISSLSHWITLLETEWLPSLAKYLKIELPNFNIEKGKTLILEHGKQISATMGSFSMMLFDSSIGFIKVLIQAGITLVALFYLLRDWPKLIQKAKQSLLTYSFGPKCIKLFADCDGVLSVFFRGQLSVMASLGAIYSVGLVLIGLDYAILLGVTAGLLSIVPYLGGIVGLTLSLLVGYLQTGDWHILLLVLGVFGVGQALESMVLTPYLVGDKLGLHPVAVIFAIMAGGELFGFFGVLLALPMAAVILVLLKNSYRPKEVGDHDVGSTAF